MIDKKSIIIFMPNKTVPEVKSVAVADCHLQMKFRVANTSSWEHPYFTSARGLSENNNHMSVENGGCNHFVSRPPETNEHGFERILNQLAVYAEHPLLNLFMAEPVVVCGALCMFREDLSNKRQNKFDEIVGM